MAIWLFENLHFENAWIPFDYANQKKLEYVFRHHDALLLHFTQCKPLDIPKTEATDLGVDESAYESLYYSIREQCLALVLDDSHFHNEPITIYPHLLLGCLSTKDILVARANTPDDIARFDKAKD